MLREYILGEAMHGLGIPTTRALAMVATGEGFGWTWVNPLPRWMPTWYAVDAIDDGARAVTLAEQALADHGEDHPWLLEVLEDARAAADDDRPDRR